MTEQLKPCPFCGSETAPAVVSIMEIEWRVCCKSIHFGCGAYIAFHDSEQDAIAAWNKRA